MFIIRSHGFFFTDEYFSPTKTFKQVVRHGVTFAQVFEVTAADKPARLNGDLHFGPDQD